MKYLMKPDNRKSIREAIKGERQKNGITQEMIADFFGVKQAQISARERDIDQNTCTRILWYLRKKGLDLNKIFDDADLQPKKNKRKL